MTRRSQSHDLLLLPTTVMKATPIPAQGREPAGDHAAKLGGHAQHLPVQRHRPSGDQHSLRHGGRPADRADAGRQALGRAHDLSRQRGVREVGRLDEVLARSTATRHRSRQSASWRWIPGQAGDAGGTSFTESETPPSCRRRRAARRAARSATSLPAASILATCGCSTTGLVAKIARSCGQALHAGGDVDGLAEVIEPVVERHREARPLVDADLDQQILLQRVHATSRMRSAAASARSGDGNVAITASPMVLTTAPASDATISLSTRKCSRTRS